MPKLIPTGRLRISPLRGQYPAQLQPCLVLPDYSLNAALGNCADNQGMEVDTLAGCSYTQPLFVPHNRKATTVSGGATSGSIVDNNAHTDANLPDWLWDTITVGGTSTKLQAFQGKPHGAQVLDCVWDADTSPAAATYDARKASVQLQGFEARVTRTIAGKIPSGSLPYWAVQWVINAALYELKVTSAAYAQLRVTADLTGATGWKMVAAHLELGSSAAQALGNAPPQGGQPQIVVSLRLMNKQLTIRLGAETTPYAVPISDPGSPPVFTQVRAQAGVFTQFDCEIHPQKFLATATLRSNPQTAGFSPQNTPYYRLIGLTSVVTRASAAPWNVTFPAGSSITVTRVGPTTNSQPQYDLAISNAAAGMYAGQTFAGLTAALVRVDTHIDGIYSTTPTAPIPLIPKEIIEEIVFDPLGLTIEQRVWATVDNMYGTWRGQAGNIAMDLWLGYQQPFLALQPRFTGMCGRYVFDRHGHANGTMRFEAQSLMRLFDVPIFAPPVMDFWNHYYAVAFLAQMAGVTLSQMAFASLVPSDPFSAAPGDPAPYFLPAGLGNRPWTPQYRQQSIRDLLDYIRKPTGYLLFFDAQGFLQYRRWVPPAAQAMKRVFTEGTAGTDGDAVTEYFDFQLISDVENTRNQVILIGIDPYDPRWSLIVSKLEDSASIYALPGDEPPNYKGFKDPFVWVDPRFASVPFAAAAAANLYPLLRLPGLEVQWPAWMQPDLYPMDTVGINESKSGTEGVPFYLMGMTTRWGYERQGATAPNAIPQRFTSTFKGTFLV